MKYPALIIPLLLLALASFCCCSIILLHYQMWYSNIPEEIITIQYYFPWLERMFTASIVSIAVQILFQFILFFAKFVKLRQTLLFVLLPPILAFVFWQLIFSTFIFPWLIHHHAPL